MCNVLLCDVCVRCCRQVCDVLCQERIMREKGLKEKEREAPTHLIELARFTHASRVTKDSYTIMHYVSKQLHVYIRTNVGYWKETQTKGEGKGERTVYSKT